MSLSIVHLCFKDDEKWWEWCWVTELSKRMRLISEDIECNQLGSAFDIASLFIML